MNSDEIKELADKIADDILSVGDEGGDKCKRIAFMVGKYPEGERSSGGAAKSSLANILQKSLQRQLASPGRSSIDPDPLIISPAGCLQDIAHCLQNHQPACECWRSRWNLTPAASLQLRGERKQ